MQPETLTVVVSEPVDVAHAFDPTNDGERLIFRELFETLIHIDCGGEVRPGLAEGWTPDESRRIWTFRLRDDSAAANLVSSWRTRPEVLAAGGIESARALEDGRLAVTLRNPEDSVPRILADPTLAVVHDRGSTLGRADRFLIARPQSPATPTEFRVEPGGDPRDALDRGADVLVTRDPALVEYVSNRAEFVTVPLPWSRTYVLAHTGELSGQLMAGLNTAAVRTSLARDAVRADARAAEPPYWWSDRERCVAAPSPQRTGEASSVVYRKDDAVARDLAERIVALGSAGTGLRSVGLEAAQFTQAVRSGTERAYVIGLPRQSLAPCRDAAMLPPGATPLPLIETRATAILRKGAPTMTADWDGTPRVVGP